MSVRYDKLAITYYYHVLNAPLSIYISSCASGWKLAVDDNWGDSKPSLSGGGYAIAVHALISGTAHRAQLPNFTHIMGLSELYWKE